jgi:hypothetical protein
MGKPECNECGRSGNGVQFPLLPRTAGHKFGTICADCDETA